MLQKLWSVSIVALLFSACIGGSGLPNVSILPDTSSVDPINPPPTRNTFATDVLLFNGNGVSTSDWQNTELIIQSEGLSYELINSSRLNSMSVDDIAKFGIIVMPGGSGGSITDGLTTAARLNLRKAVRERGVGFVGFCAGAWVAVGPEANTDAIAGYGFAIAEGEVLDLFYPNGQAPTAAIVDVSFSDGSHRNLVWWGGPVTPEWSRGVVARYNDGKPAISQTWAGQGLVVISGPHPEAPDGWRATAGNDPDGLDYDIAIKMFRAALDKAPLSAFP